MNKDRKPRNDIPLEALLKYIKADRDAYRSKLDELIPYTKSLESQNKDLRKEIEVLRKEKAALMREVTRTDVYRGLLERYTRLKRDKEVLLEKLAKHDTDTFDLG